MSATTILWGQLFAVLLIVFSCVWAATQWAAHALAYQPESGRSWCWIADHRVYQPFAFFFWRFGFDAYAPKIFGIGAAIAASGGLLSVAIAIAMSVWRAREATSGGFVWAWTSIPKSAERQLTT